VNTTPLTGSVKPSVSAGSGSATARTCASQKRSPARNSPLKVNSSTLPTRLTSRAETVISASCHWSSRTALNQTRLQGRPQPGPPDTAMLV
jgi:hypothetical protein